MTGSIHTVLGPVPPTALERVLPHEHIFCDFSRVTRQLDHVLNDRSLAEHELAVLPSTGVNCIVDMTTADFGRNPEALMRISEATGLHVVMGTGWYREPYYPNEIDQLSVDSIARQMMEELTNGVVIADGSLVPAGIIGEIGVDQNFVSAREERVFRAAARASNATGAPISTHTGIYPTGIAQLELLHEELVDPRRIVIGHADMYLDRDYHSVILRSGAYLQFDTTGRTHLNPDERRADFLIELVRGGRLEQLLLSSDRCFRSDLVAFGGAGYAHAVTKFAELLFERGLSTEEFDVLTKDNPTRMLTWER